MTIDMLIVKEFSMAQRRRALEIYYNQNDRAEAWGAERELDRMKKSKDETADD
jgi:hypothetical protein